MKKLLLFLSIIILASCSTNGGEDTPVAITSIQINEISKDLDVGDTYQMKVTTLPASSIKPTWTSSNTAVATISSSGLLKAHSEGLTTVTATYGVLTDSKSVVIASQQQQDHTSFVFYTPEDLILPNCVAGYFDQDGFCWKIGDLGELTKGLMSPEIFVEDNSISDIYFFSDYPTSSTMLEYKFKLKSYSKNIFQIIPGTKGIEVNNTNPKQYPQVKSDD